MTMIKSRNRTEWNGNIGPGYGQVQICGRVKSEKGISEVLFCECLASHSLNRLEWRWMTIILVLSSWIYFVKEIMK